jgi:hypothetical protein
MPAINKPKRSVQDEQVRSTFDGVASGLTAYLRDAIRANAARAENATR